MKYFYRALGVCLGAVFLEAAYFGVVLSGANRMVDADAIVVFCGASGRVEAGAALQRLGYAPRLILSPNGWQRLVKRPLQAAEFLIIEDRARTTFENALYTREIIIKHGIRSLILVTSDYHVPRSNFLLKCLLLDQNVHITPYKVTSDGDAGIFPPKNIRSLKTLLNEMVKLWGSLGELVVYTIRGRVPETPFKKTKVLRMMKKFFLFGL